MYYLLMYDVVEDYVERRKPYRPDHLSYAKLAQDRGELLMGGALANPVDGAVLVFKAESPAIIEAFARNDPYVRNGVVTGWRVRGWTVVIGGDPG